MPFANLSHVTTYRYSQPARFGDHRPMVRARESYDQYLLETTLQIDREPSNRRWLHDVFGRAVAIATFSGQIRVAVARDIYQAIPISGTWAGLQCSFVGMDVAVDAYVDSPTRKNGTF